jgi:hypothetical protein
LASFGIIWHHAPEKATAVTCATSSGSCDLHERGRPSSFKSNRAGNRPSEIGPAGNLAKPFIGPWRSPGIWSTSVSRQRPSAYQMRHGYPPVSTQPQMIQQDAISIFFPKCLILSHFVSFLRVRPSIFFRKRGSVASERPGIGGVSHSLHTGCQGVRPYFGLTPPSGSDWSEWQTVPER